MIQQNKQPYLKKLKLEDPEKLRETREKALNLRRVKSCKMKTIKDLMKGSLELAICITDPKTNTLKTDANGDVLRITKKELLVMNTLDKAISNPSVRDLMDIEKLIGEADNTRENNINITLNSIRNEIDAIGNN